MPFPFFRQPDIMDCGPTCLRMVAAHYKRSISLQTLRERSAIGKEGVNLLGICEAATSIGLINEAVRISIGALVNQAPLPAILHWKQQHFVVLYKSKNKRFYIADPGLGRISFNEQDFRTYWTNGAGDEGVALLLQPSPCFYEQLDDDFQQPASNSMKAIYKYLLPYKSLVAQILACLLAASLLQLLLPFLTKSIVDTGIATGNIDFIYIILIAQFALFAGRLVMEFVRSWILLHISTRINISILTGFLIKLMKLPVSYFESKHTGDILQRMSDHSRIDNFLTGSSLGILFSLLNLVVFSLVLCLFNFEIFLVFAIASVIYAVWVVLFLKKKRALDFKRFELAAREQSATIQLVQGMQEIKLQGIENKMRWTWERIQAGLFSLTTQGLALNQWQQSGAFFINEGKNILITFYTAKSVINGGMTFGEMLAVQYIMGQLNSPIEQMIAFVQSWQNARISIERLNEIHSLSDEEPTEKKLLTSLPRAFAMKLSGGQASIDRSGQTNKEQDSLVIESFPDLHFHAAARPSSHIRFRDITFTYPGAGNTPVLRNIDLIIPQGKTTAIVGASGSGKTTLLKLLLRFQEPQSGEILLNSTPLHTISHRYWRSHCGVVMQDSYIFSDSIAANIAVGEEAPDMQRLKQAVNIASLSDFLESLPLGFDTKIGSEGAGISAGQKQRLLIARAVYRDPMLILFDEATNNLDANNESRIIANLEAFFKGKTVVVVAHRLSTVRNADQIIVLSRGRIAECGTHNALIESRGEYFNLIRNQLELGT